MLRKFLRPPVERVTHRIPSADGSLCAPIATPGRLAGRERRIPFLPVTNVDILSAMGIAEAKRAVDQILDEERQRPKIRYEVAPGEPPKASVAASLEALMRWSELKEGRQENPRPVTESPQIFRFSGETFDMLLSLYRSSDESDHAQLLDYMLERVRSGGTGTCPRPQSHTIPTFAGKVSELPLIAEFCIRTGGIESFFKATGVPRMPTDSLAIMLMQLEETVALNWNWFSNEQLGKIPGWLDHLRIHASLQTWAQRPPHGGSGPVEGNPSYVPGHEAEATQIVRSIDGIAKECEQARYLYLKGSLLQTVNLEIESDKAKVESSLTKLGFSNDMIEVLNAAERDYRSATDRFELKSCLGHLRSFLEQLHWQAAKGIGVTGLNADKKWGSATGLLRKKGYLTKQHEAFVVSLYALFSDEGVHPLGADREYARLLRNVVIEYGVMFLAVLDRKAVKTR